MVERSSYTRLVPGSNPGVPTRFYVLPLAGPFATLPDSASAQRRILLCANPRSRSRNRDTHTPYWNVAMYMPRMVRRMKNTMSPPGVVGSPSRKRRKMVRRETRKLMMNSTNPSAGDQTLILSQSSPM